MVCDEPSLLVFAVFCLLPTFRNSRRLWLFPGSVRGFSRKTPGKSRESCWKKCPESRNATNSRISGTGKGKPAGNLGPHCRHLVPTFRAGCFLKSTVPAFSSFSETFVLRMAQFVHAEVDQQQLREQVESSWQRPMKLVGFRHQVYEHETGHEGVHLR